MAIRQRFTVVKGNKSSRMRRRLINRGSVKNLMPALKAAEPEKPIPICRIKPLKCENSKQKIHKSLKKWLKFLPEIGTVMHFRDMMRVYVVPYVNNNVTIEGFIVHIEPTYKSVGIMEEGMVEITGISIHYTVNEVPSGPVGIIRTFKNEWYEKIQEFHNDRIIKRKFTPRT